VQMTCWSHILVAAWLACCTFAVSTKVVEKVRVPGGETLQKVIDAIQDLEKDVTAAKATAIEDNTKYTALYTKTKSTHENELEQETELKNKADAAWSGATADVTDATKKLASSATTMGTVEQSLAIEEKRRANDKKAFQDKEKDLTDTVGTLDKAIDILKQKLNKHSSSTALNQVNMKSLSAVLNTLGTMLDAVSLPLDGRQKLM